MSLVSIALYSLLFPEISHETAFCSIHPDNTTESPVPYRISLFASMSLVKLMIAVDSPERVIFFVIIFGASPIDCSSTCNIQRRLSLFPELILFSKAILLSQPRIMALRTSLIEAFDL